MPDKVTDANVEKRVGGGRVVDVLLLAVSESVAAVEVFHKHAVDAQKQADLDLPWIEVEALDILRSKGLVLRPVCDRMNPRKACAQCTEKRKLEEEMKKQKAQRRTQLRAAAEERARQLDDLHRADRPKLEKLAGYELPPSSLYLAVPLLCRTCKRKTGVSFAWSGWLVGVAPPEPRPTTIRYVNWGHGGNYWTNHCPVCGAKHGQNEFIADRDAYDGILLGRARREEMSD